MPHIVYYRFSKKLYAPRMDKYMIYYLITVHTEYNIEAATRWVRTGFSTKKRKTASHATFTWSGKTTRSRTNQPQRLQQPCLSKTHRSISVIKYYEWTSAATPKHQDHKNLAFPNFPMFWDRIFSHTLDKLQYPTSCKQLADTYQNTENPS